MALIFSCTMFAVYAVVPKDAAVAAKAKATVKEAPETAAEAEALRSSQDTDAGFNIYTEESNYNYDDTSDSTDDTAASDQTTYNPGTYSSDDTTSSDVADEGTAEDGSYDSSDQIDYPSDDNNGDTPDDNNDYDSSQDNGDYSDDTSEEGASDNTDRPPFLVFYPLARQRAKVRTHKGERCRRIVINERGHVFFVKFLFKIPIGCDLFDKLKIFHRLAGIKLLNLA